MARFVRMVRILAWKRDMRCEWWFFARARLSHAFVVQHHVRCCCPPEISTVRVFNPNATHLYRIHDIYIIIAIVIIFVLLLLLYIKPYRLYLECCANLLMQRLILNTISSCLWVLVYLFLFSHTECFLLFRNIFRRWQAVEEHMPLIR